MYLGKVMREEVVRPTESFPYFYQVFRGDEYLRVADLICARGFAGRRVSQSSPSPFFFLLPVPFMLQQARRGGEGKECVGKRVRKVGETTEGVSVAAERGGGACFPKYFTAIIGS